jgi:hypothetical protein
LLFIIETSGGTGKQAGSREGSKGRPARAASRPSEHQTDAHLT